MKALSSTLSLLLFLTVIGLAERSLAEIIGADDFSESDGTPVDGKLADVGGAWSAPAGLTVEGGVLDTDQVGQHQGSFLNLARALGPGERLTMTFESAETTGEMFLLNGYAGMSFYVGGDEKLFVGDPGGGQAVDGWALDGFAGGGPSTYTGLQSEAVTGTWTYNYDTGLGTLMVSDGATVGSTTHSYDAGLALDRFRIQSGSDDAAALAISSFSISADPVPEPGSFVVLTALLGLSAGGQRRPA